jgi:hypothetical protein
VDGLRKAKQLMVNSWRETRCRLSQDSKRWKSDMKHVSFRGPKNIMRKHMQLSRPAFVHPWLVRFRLKVLSLYLKTAAGFCFVRISRRILWKNNFPSIILGVTRRVTGNFRFHEKGPLTSDLREESPSGGWRTFCIDSTAFGQLRLCSGNVIFAMYNKDISFAIRTSLVCSWRSFRVTCAKVVYLSVSHLWSWFLFSFFFCYIIMWSRKSLTLGLMSRRWSI